MRLKKLLVENDEGPRADTTVEVLGKLRPVFRAGGSVTAGPGRLAFSRGPQSSC